MPGLASLAGLGTTFGFGNKVDTLKIYPLDPKTGSVYRVPRYLILPYFPETISDKRTVNWSAKEYPGASHPIYQWVSGGERALSFSTVLTQELAPDILFPPLSGRIMDFSQANKRSVGVNDIIYILRSFTYPTYDQGIAYPPETLLMIFPKGFKISRNRDNRFFCIETGCDIEYEDLWEDGTPRKAVVTLEFAEIIQSKNGIKFVDRSEFVSRPWENVKNYNPSKL